jgi:DnaJ family protein C protein 7
MKTASNGDVELLTLRARIFYGMGDIDNALKHLQQAVRADPDNVPTRNFFRQIRDMAEAKKVGDEHFRTGNNDAAIASWTNAIELATNNPSFLSKLYLNRAIAKSKMDAHTDAVKDCSFAIKHDKGYVKAFMRRADCYLALGGPDNIQAAIRLVSW